MQRGHRARFLTVMSDTQTPTDEWSDLVPFLEQIPRAVRLVVWGDEVGGRWEREAIRVAWALSQRFARLSFELRPRRPDYGFYPVWGVMGLEGEEELDFGVRIIGLPAGFQMTTLLGAIQAVTFRGQQVEPKTRIQLSRMPAPAEIEIITDSADEAGPQMATMCFALAVCSPLIRAYAIMADCFPVALQQFNVHYLPHTVINGRVHMEGVLDEAQFLRHLAMAVKKQP